MLVSYTRDSSLTEINTLRCQVAGLLKVIEITIFDTVLHIFCLSLTWIKLRDMTLLSLK